MQKTETASFEQSLQTLEQLVKQIDSGELSLEASLSAFEQGIGLVRQCQQQLQNAEQKVAMLVENAQGLELQAFPSSVTSKSNDDLPF